MGVAGIVNDLSLRPAPKGGEYDGMAARRIVAVVYPNVQVLDVTGPLEVFAMADRLAGAGTGATYRNEVVSAAGGLTPTTSGIALDTIPMRECRGAIDTLVVA